MKHDNGAAEAGEDVFVHKTLTILVVNFPLEEVRVYLDYFWQFPEFHVVHCPDMESGLNELRQGQTPGGLLYTNDAEEALTFLRQVSETLEVAQSKIPLFFIPVADQNSEGAVVLTRAGGHPSPICHPKRRLIIF